MMHWFVAKVHGNFFVLSHHVLIDKLVGVESLGCIVVRRAPKFTTPRRQHSRLRLSIGLSHVGVLVAPRPLTPVL